MRVVIVSFVGGEVTFFGKEVEAAVDETDGTLTVKGWETPDRSGNTIFAAGKWIYASFANVKDAVA